MKIRYILGSSGSSKLSNCIEEVLSFQEKNFYYSGVIIVPEQFSLEVEKLIIKKSKSKVLFNTQVLSFKRLAFRVFSKLGMNNKTSIEDIGKVILIKKILYNLLENNSLLYFDESSSHNIGLIDKIIKIIEEFFECNISIDDIKSSIENLESNLKLKLLDLSKIYEEYINITQNDYITNESILDILSQKIGEVDFLNKDSVVWIYGFDGFTNQELEVIKSLVQVVKKVNIYFTLNTDKIDINKIDILDPFFEIKNSIKKINDKIIKHLSVELEEVVYLKENKLHENNEELKFLEQNYFLFLNKQYLEPVENIKIFNTKNKYIEIENVARKIVNLVRHENYKYKDVAVILASNSYNHHVINIFNKYNIPYFLDYKKSIKTHALSELIFSVLDIIKYNWQYDSVFSYLKLGFLEESKVFKISKEEIDLLENYVLKYGIKGKYWKSEFKYGFNNSDFDFESLNRVRETVLNSLSTLSFKPNKKYKVEDIAKKIFDFFIKINVDSTLNIWQERDKEIFLKNISSNTNIYNEHIQVWNSICEIFEKYIDVLGEDEISIDEFSKILKVAFEKQTISFLPPTQDQVLIGDFERTKLSKVKVMFCLGMNEGVIPKYKENNLFLSDEEKVLLLANNLELRPTSSTNLAISNFKVYSIISKATERLYLSFTSSSLDGKPKNPSFIIKRVLNMFPKLELEYIENLTLEIFNEKTLLEQIFCNYNINKFFKDEVYKEKIINIFKWLLDKEYFNLKIKNIKYGLENIKSSDNIYIKSELIKMLYKDNKLFSSISKLEEFRKCPFSYFLKYNMKVKNREFYDLDALKIGNLYHSILEEFSIIFFSNKDNLKNLNKDNICIFLDKAIKKVKENSEVSYLFEFSPKYEYYFERIKKITSMSLIAIIEQIKNSKFIPEDFEVSFGNMNQNKEIFNDIKIVLENNYELVLNGKIDRVDILETENNKYVKIIDYKSSDKVLSIEEVYYGLQLQILAYLNSFMKINQKFSNKDILPAGAFYFQVKEPIVENLKDKEGLQKELDKIYKLRGVLIEDYEILKGIEQSIPEVSKEDIDKGNLKIKASSFSKNDIITKEQFDKLLKLSNILSKEIGNDIISGNINIKPYKYKKKLGCEYCEYKSICKIGLIEKEDKFNNLKPLNKDLIWQKIDEKLKE